MGEGGEERRSDTQTREQTRRLEARREWRGREERGERRLGERSEGVNRESWHPGTDIGHLVVRWN